MRIRDILAVLAILPLVNMLLVVLLHQLITAPGWTGLVLAAGFLFYWGMERLTAPSITQEPRGGPEAGAAMDPGPRTNELTPTGPCSHPRATMTLYLEDSTRDYLTCTDCGATRGRRGGWTSGALGRRKTNDIKG